METDDGDWSIPCLDFANRPRTLRLLLTHPAGLALVVPPGDAAILVPDRIGNLISFSQEARSALLKGRRSGAVLL